MRPWPFQGFSSSSLKGWLETRQKAIKAVQEVGLSDSEQLFLKFIGGSINYVLCSSKLTQLAYCIVYFHSNYVALYT